MTDRPNRHDRTEPTTTHPDAPVNRHTDRTDDGPRTVTLTDLDVADLGADVTRLADQATSLAHTIGNHCTDALPVLARIVAAVDTVIGPDNDWPVIDDAELARWQHAVDTITAMLETLPMLNGSRPSDELAALHAQLDHPVPSPDPDEHQTR